MRGNLRQANEGQANDCKRGLLKRERKEIKDGGVKVGGHVARSVSCDRCIGVMISRRGLVTGRHSMWQVETTHFVGAFLYSPMPPCV